MKIYDIPYITVEETGGMYRINADDGWCIHLPQHEEDVYKKAVALPENYEFDTMQIVSQTEVEGAEQKVT